MGIIVEASCICGFKIDKMYLGRGMNTSYNISFETLNIVSPDRYLGGCIDTCLFPYYCKDCKHLFCANLYYKDVVCNHCRSINIVLYNNSYVIKNLNNELSCNFHNNITDEFIKLSKINNLCPHCDEFSLEFKSIGMWD